jgi:hypothetical protein
MADTAADVTKTALLVRNQRKDQSGTCWLDEEGATPEGYIAEQYGIWLLYLRGNISSSRQRVRDDMAHDLVAIKETFDIRRLIVEMNTWPTNEHGRCGYKRLDIGEDSQTKTLRPRGRKARS